MKIESLNQHVTKRDWSGLERFFHDELAEASAGAYLFIEAIYLLETVILESPPISKTEFERVHPLLQRVFGESLKRFRNDPEYLFYTGYFIALCDWCFGLDGLELSHEMLRRATELEPENALYRWGYSFSTSKEDSMVLSKQLNEDASLLEATSSKGEAGRFIVDAVKNAPYFLSLPK